MVTMKMDEILPNFLLHWSSRLLPSLSTCSIILSFTLVYIWYQHPKYGKNPGGTTFPLVGNWFSVLWNLDRVHDWGTTCMRNSPTMTIKNTRPGSSGFWLTANPANVEYMLRTNFENYPKGDEWQETMCDLLGDGIFNADGETWKLQRRVASHEFTTRSLRSFMVGAVGDELHGRLIPILERTCNIGVLVDLQDLFTRFTFDTICRLGFGVDPACLDASLPPVKFARAFDDATTITTFRFFNLPFIWKTMRALDIGSQKSLRKAVGNIDEFAMYVIKTRRKQTVETSDSKSVEDGSSEHLDLLSRFMGLAPKEQEEGSHEQPAKEKERGDGEMYSDVFLRDIIISFVLAGRETSASGLSWLFWLLTCNRRVEDSIYEEISNIILSREQPHHDVSFTFEELKRMHYLHAAVTESLRLYPPVPVDLKMAQNADIWPDGTKISAKMRVGYCPYAMARMESIWGSDCLEFKPERWLKDGIFVPENPYKYPVFHAGPRTCLGKELAMIQMKMVVAGLLQRFTFSTTDGFVPKYKLSLTMPMKNRLPVTVHQRMMLTNFIS